MQPAVGSECPRDRTDESAAPHSGTLDSPISMIDIVYIVATVGFFALMLLYVRSCERLGRDTTDTTERAP